MDQVIAQQQGGPIDLYFLDVNTTELFTASSDRIPPIEAPSDKEANREAEEESEKQYSGVRAQVFTCTTCDDEDDRWIGYLEKYTPEAKAAMEEAIRGDGAPDLEAIHELEDERLVKLPTKDDWIKASSEEAVDIYTAIRDRCEEDQRPRQCFPGRH
ncbi:MAG: hypothetical protein GVY24_05405 [Planctomycetes bacterium]|nr:hypothetical protein [Planctomycetota bacterium]